MSGSGRILEQGGAGGERWERKHDRVAGPFDGYRVGLLETAVRIYDLSLGGCFVNSTHEQREGSRVVLRIDLPIEGWITVTAETVNSQPGFGFAVRFVDADADTAARLNRTVETLMEQQSAERRHDLRIEPV